MQRRLRIRRKATFEERLAAEVAAAKRAGLDDFPGPRARKAHLQGASSRDGIAYQRMGFLDGPASTK
jgi:uncharacterized MAPEG superfamily protein